MAVWSVKRDCPVGELGIDYDWNRILRQASSLLSASPRMGVVVPLRLGLKNGIDYDREPMAEAFRLFSDRFT